MDDENKLAKQVLKRFEALKEDRRAFEPLWSEAEAYVAAIQQEWDDEKPKQPYKIPRATLKNSCLPILLILGTHIFAPKPRHTPSMATFCRFNLCPNLSQSWLPLVFQRVRRRITNRPTSFLNTCVTGLAGYAMSPNINWFKLALMDASLAEASGVAQWLEQCEKLMRRTFERCGFYRQGLRWLEESGIYGHAAMLIEELHNADAPIRYYVPPAQEFYLDDNEIGETDVVFRSYWSDIENVINHYGRKAMHENILKKFDDCENMDGYAKNAGIDMSMKLLHAVYVRRTGKPDYGETVANKKWASVVIDVANKHVIRESGYDEFPYAMFFWERIGKAYGISPSMKAINDIALFHTSTDTMTRLAQKVSNPSIIMYENQKNHINFAPGGISYIRDGTQPPNQLPIAGDYPITMEIFRYMEQNVKDWFNVDFFPHAPAAGEHPEHDRYGGGGDAGRTGGVAVRAGVQYVRGA